MILIFLVIHENIYLLKHTAQLDKPICNVQLKIRHQTKRFDVHRVGKSVTRIHMHVQVTKLILTKSQTLEKYRIKLLTLPVKYLSCSTVPSEKEIIVGVPCSSFTSVRISDVVIFLAM